MQARALSNQRITTVDALRGFALLGILVAHFIYWYTGGALPQQVYAQFNDPGSNAVSLINGIFIFGKFFTFFSFLFGLSFFLQIQSLQKKEGNFALRYGWRLVILGVIGLLHHALWRGDILSIYVPLGFILLFIRNISNRLLFIIAFLLILNVPARIIDIIHLFNQKPAAGIIPPQPEAEAQRYYDVVKSGSFMAMVKDNWKALYSKFVFQFESGRIYITLGFFMMGMYVGRMKWFENASNAKPLIKRICKISGWVSLGIVLTVIGLFAANTTMKLGLETKPSIQLLFGFLFDIANSSLTIFYLSGLTMLMYRLRWQIFLYSLAPVGKMALTMYLSQTFFGLLLFYHFGFGLFLKTAPWVNVLLIFPVYLLQVLLAKWWFTYFNYGPVEWLWRSLTFLRWYPLKKRQMASAAMTTNVG